MEPTRVYMPMRRRLGIELDNWQLEAERPEHNLH
jgi:hypothetical protein